jgi:WD40 repeat protein
MSTTLPTAPPPPPRVDSPEDLEALIEEARRRARRRRRWYAAPALLATGAVASAFAGYHHGGGGGSLETKPAGARPNAPAARGNAGPSAAASAVARNGPITIISGASVSAVLPPGRLGALYNCNCELTSIDWAPDGTRLAFAAATLNHWSAFNGIHIRNLTTRKGRHLPREKAFDLDWSADGRRIAYVEWGGFGTINVMSARTARRERIIHTGSEGRDSSPSWSPRGDRLAFASYSNSASTISVIALTGARRTLLARHASAPAWSPRGGKIAYRSRCGIKLVTPAGRDVTPQGRRRCRAIGVVGTPFWSPDGRQIGIQTKRGIYTMNADGSDLGLVITVERGLGPFNSGRPSWRPRQ